MEALEEQKVNKDEYSWFKMHFRFFKRKTIFFLEEFIKNCHRIQWSDSKKVFRETCFVLVISGILVIFFYLVFMLMEYIT